jgi:hypothetical protein
LKDYRINKPSPAMRRFMAHVVNTGGWLPSDPIKVHSRVVNRCAELEWITLDKGGAIVTAKGRAAFAWLMKEESGAAS